MGYDLYNSKGSEFRWSMKSWRVLLRLALDYGWQPLGVISGDDEDIHFKVDPQDYLSNAHQIVNSEDTNNLSNALIKAINDIPETVIDEKLNCNQTEFIEAENFEEAIRRFISREFKSQSDPLVYFSGPDSRQYIEEFIEFCNEGYFLIC